MRLSASFFSTRTLSYRRSLTYFWLGEFYSVNRSLCSSSGEDDKFSELGSPVTNSVSTFPKLMTAKPEPYLTDKKTLATRKASTGISLNVDMKGTLSTADNFSPAARLQPKDPSHGSKSNSRKNVSYSGALNLIVVENIPSTISLCQVKDALSVFGKITNVSMRTNLNKPSCCHVVFKSIESRKRALSIGGITILGVNLPICALHHKEITINIHNISSETSDCEVHSLCMSYGDLKGLVRTKEDAMDAVFSVKDDLHTQRLLYNLNRTILDKSKWSANLHPEDPAPSLTTKDDDAQCNLEVDINDHIAEVRRQLEHKRMLVEDLEYLHNSLIYLRANAASNNNLSDI
ncbi:sucrose-phosphatase-related [Quillaja saponaria]|uniref:Sucrose-phosphatase-related n=1 Tax=Quillaja saponaria TaxID=32244 RepID=A0AAD7VJ52_QUISA|nr:sucrose-phosphatase-related [Quillaja saponaria]